MCSNEVSYCLLVVLVATVSTTCLAFEENITCEEVMEGSQSLTEMQDTICQNALNENCTFLSNLTSCSTDTQKSNQPTIRIIDTGSISKESYDSVVWIFTVSVLPITIVLGFIGNMLSFRTFLHMPSKDAVTIYLIGLCITDTLTILLNSLGIVEPIVARFDNLLSVQIRLIKFRFKDLFLGPIVHINSGFITSVFSLERMLAVRYPLRAKDGVLKKHPWKVIFSGFLFVFIIFFPNFFRFDLSIIENPATNKSFLLILPSEFSRSTDLYTYLGTIALVAARILPMVVVIIVNVITITSLRASMRTRQSLTDKKISNNNVTRMLLTISAIYLMCVSPSVTSNLISKWLDSYGLNTAEHYLYILINYIGAYLDILNASINFVVYMLLGSAFRQAFFEVFRCFRRQTKT